MGVIIPLPVHSEATVHNLVVVTLYTLAGQSWPLEAAVHKLVIINVSKAQMRIFQY